jgi:Restriction alleviation protein Lar
VELRRPSHPASRFTIRACPFCGRSSEFAVVEELRSFEGMSCKTLHQVICRCGARGPALPTATEATDAWNARQSNQEQRPGTEQARAVTAVA